MSLIKITLLVILLSVSSIVVLFFITISQSQNNADFIVQTESKSPEIALEKFWQSSFNGNEKMVNAIASLPSDDWLNSCVGKSLSNQNTSNSNHTVLDKEIVTESKTVEGEKGYNTDLEVSFSGENISDNIRIFSRYIYGSKIKWNRFNVTDKRSYNDEALLNVEIANYSGDFSNSEKFVFAFKKVEDEWKIIGIIQTGVFKFVDDQIHYGSFRPVCK